MEARALGGRFRSKADEAHARLLVQAEDRLSYERTSHDFLLKEQQRTAAALQRASCEARVLVSSIRRLEADVHERMQLGPPAAREAAVSNGNHGVDMALRVDWAS